MTSVLGIFPPGVTHASDVPDRIMQMENFLTALVEHLTGKTKHHRHLFHDLLPI